MLETLYSSHMVGTCACLLLRCLPSNQGLESRRAHQTLNIETSVGVAYEDFMLKSSIEGELNW